MARDLQSISAPKAAIHRSCRSPRGRVKLFSCSQCEQVLFFENTVCTHCGQSVGYCVEAETLAAIPKTEEPNEPFDVPLPGRRVEKYVKCKNFVDRDACNWLVRAGDEEPYCRSCRLSAVIPDLTDAKNQAAWLEIERAKRRLLYAIYALNLPVAAKTEDPEGGLRFEFLRGTDEDPVMTGHDDGVITLNVAEAEAAYRENMREKLGEGYRTVLGHLRHEIGHYYWDRLIGSGPSLGAFRERFGNESSSYEDALKRHYDEGPPSNWSESFISAYATMHPWEDWAETWAHYMHMIDTLETAKAHGLTVQIRSKAARDKVVTNTLAFRDYDSLSWGWQAVTVALNNLTRSMGMKDVYPFVLSPVVQGKLRFVHEVIQSAATSITPSATAPKSAAGRWGRR